MLLLCVVYAVINILTNLYCYTKSIQILRNQTGRDYVEYLMQSSPILYLKISIPYVRTSDINHINLFV